MRNKYKLKGIIAAAIIVFAAMTQAVLAENTGKSAQEGIWEYEMTQAGVSDYDEYLNAGLVPFAGNGADWLVIYMKESGIEADYEAYNEALDEYLLTAGELKATDYERIGLVKACIGVDSSFITDVIENQTGQSGIMSIIYGLMLAVSNDYVSDDVLCQIADSLIALQLDDGGWNLNGQYSDTDVTAMALQALAPLYEHGYGENIEKGIARLSGLQRDNGGYASYGIDNSESTAQVLLALCALDIDYKTDTRFIKNDVTVYDALMTYATDEGGFSHTADDKTNAMATTQALSALVCIDKYEKTGRFIYDFKDTDIINNTIEAKEPETKASETEQTHGEQETINAQEQNGSVNGIRGVTIKYIIMGLIAFGALITILVCAVKKRLNVVKALIILAVGTALAIAAGLCRFETVSEHYASKSEQGDVVTYITIKGYDGEIAERTCVYIDEDDTAFDQLLNLVVEKHINIDYSGSKILGNIYVKSIDGLAEFDYGNMSGWTYYINGDMPDVSCSAYKLKQDDEVQWIYTDGKEYTEADE